MQGSPLSPLLANLFLDPFDEAMTGRGFRLIRYADDFIILTRSAEEADEALKAAEEVLRPMKLSLKEAKTASGPVEAGFQFLGLEMAPGIDEAFVEKTALRRPLFIRQQFSFVGLDGDALTVRSGGRLVERIPLHRIGEIVVFGGNSLSSQLMNRCAEMKIPISFCLAGGRYVSTLRPDHKPHFDLSGRHLERRAATGEEESLRIAARIVKSKIASYLAWCRECRSSDGQELSDALARRLQDVERAESIDALRGVEGVAAAATFRFVNDRVTAPEFASSHRLRRRKADRYNCLLDFAYSLLFTRLNVLIRSRGLNPYLGFLHSPANDFESLVCDLQEPFRCRMDRMVLKLINRRQLRHDQIEPRVNGGMRLNPEAMRTFLQAFEREQHIRLSGDPGTLLELLHSQVSQLVGWVQGRSHPEFYQVGR